MSPISESILTLKTGCISGILILDPCLHLIAKKSAVNFMSSVSSECSLPGAEGWGADF